MEAEINTLCACVRGYVCVAVVREGFIIHMILFPWNADACTIPQTTSHPMLGINSDHDLCPTLKRA
jgi:hypothetical protein